MGFSLFIKLAIVLSILAVSLFIKKRVGNRQFNHFIIVVQLGNLFMYLTDTFYRIAISAFTFDIIFWSLCLLGIVCLIDSISNVSRLAFFNIPVTFIYLILTAYFIGHR